MYDRNENLTSDLSNWFYIRHLLVSSSIKVRSKFPSFPFFLLFPDAFCYFFFPYVPVYRSYIQVNQKLGSDGKWLNILFRIVIARSTDALVQSSRKRLVTIKFGVLIEDRFEWEINTCLVSIFFFFSFLLASSSYFFFLPRSSPPSPSLRSSFSLFSSTQSLRAKFLPRLIINSLTCHKNKYFYHIA